MHARVARGHTVLVTGIGGGVALLAMQLCLALGARVYVTSGSDAKLARAIALGAAGGVNYTHGESAFLGFFSPPPLFVHGGNGNSFRLDGKWRSLCDRRLADGAEERPWRVAA